MLREKTKNKIMRKLMLGVDANINTNEKAELRRLYRLEIEYGKRKVKNIPCIPSDENVREYMENGLSIVLNSKVKSYGDANKGYVKRRIETYSPILNGQDEQMKEELLAFIGSWLALNEIEMYYDNRFGWSPFFPDYETYKRLLVEVGKYMDSLSNARLKQKRVKKYNPDGTVDRYQLTEKDIEEGRKIGKPKYNVYLTVAPLEIDTEKGSLTLDSKAYNDYLKENSSIIDMKEVYELSEKVRTKVKFNHWKVWYKYHIDNVDMVTLGKEIGVNKSTISRWIKLVDNTVKQMKEIQAVKEGIDKSIGYNRNYIRIDSSQGKENCCAYVQSTDRKPVGYTGSIDYTIGDARYQTCDWKLNTNEDTCIEIPHFDFSWYNDFLPLEKSDKREYWKNTRCIKPFEKRTSRGQGTHLYSPSLKGVRNGEWTR